MTISPILTSDWLKVSLVTLEKVCKWGRIFTYSHRSLTNLENKSPGKFINLMKKWWILVGHFWNAFQSDNENYSVREPLHTKVDNDKTIRKRRVNRDQTYNRFNVYCLLTKRPTLDCFHKITQDRITCLITYNGQGYFSGRNLTPLEKGIPTTELVWFTLPRDKNVMESSQVANKYIFLYSRSVVS